METKEEMTTTTTDTRDSINVRPGIEFEPDRAEVRGYSQQNEENEQTKSEGFDNNLSVYHHFVSLTHQQYGSEPQFVYNENETWCPRFGA